MGADYAEMIAKLQAGLAQQQQQGPSLFGLQAAPDPNNTAQLLQHLQNQQYVNEQGNQGGEYGFLANAGKKDFARAGQSLGALLGVGQAPKQDNSAIMQQRQAIQDGKAQLAQGLSQPNADPNQVQMQVLTRLAQQGVPGAADALEKANDNASKLALAKAQIFKDTAQGASANDEIKNRAAQQAHQSFEEGGQTWNFVSEKDGVQLYKNANGEPKVVTTQPSKTLPGPPVDPAQAATIVQAIKDGRMKPVDPSGTFAKSPLGQAVLQAQAADPTIDATSYGTKIKTLKDFSTGAEGKAVTSFNVAQTHLDTLSEAAKALDNNSLPVANRVLNTMGVQSGGTSQAAFAATKNVVANEIVKTIVPGQSAVGDREEVQNEITAAQTPAQLQAVISKYQELMSGKLAGLRQQYEQGSGRTDFESKLSKRSIELARQSASYTSQFPNPTTGAAPASTGWGQAVVK